MKLAKFFKILSYKVKKYDEKYKTNGFNKIEPITLVWVENNLEKKKK